MIESRSILIDDSVTMSEVTSTQPERPSDHQYSNPTFDNEEEMYEVDHVENDDIISIDSERETRRCSSFCCKLEYVTVAILFAINLLNYMDRYTLAGKRNYLLFSLYTIHLLLLSNVWGISFGPMAAKMQTVT